MKPSSNNSQESDTLLTVTTLLIGVIVRIIVALGPYIRGDYIRYNSTPQHPTIPSFYENEPGWAVNSINEEDYRDFRDCHL